MKKLIILTFCSLCTTAALAEDNCKNGLKAAGLKELLSKNIGTLLKNPATLKQDGVEYVFPQLMPKNDTAPESLAKRMEKSIITIKDAGKAATDACKIQVELPEEKILPEAK